MNLMYGKCLYQYKKLRECNHFVQTSPIYVGEIRVDVFGFFVSPDRRKRTFRVIVLDPFHRACVARRDASENITESVVNEWPLR